LHKHGFTWNDFPHLAGNTITVERSENGAIFNPLATLTTHRGNQPNSFEDPAPLPGTNYYRLTAVAADGSNITSNVLAIENNNPASIKIYPNPVKNNLVIEGLPSAGNTKLRITDLYGNNVYKATATANTFNCNIASLKASAYIIIIETGNETITRKFVKE